MNRVVKVSTLDTSKIGIHTFTIQIENTLITEEPNKTFQESFTIEILSAVNPPPTFENLVDSVSFFDLQSFSQTDLVLGAILTSVETDTPSLISFEVVP